MQSHYHTSDTIIFYQDKNTIITEVYTIVLNSSSTFTMSEYPRG